MTTKKNQFNIRAKVWIYKGEAIHSSNASAMQGAWHFITIPKKQSDTIKKMFGDMARGWGSLPVTVILGKATWKTSIFPDKKLGAYLLPLKAEVRKKEKIADGDTVTFLLEIRI